MNKKKTMMKKTTKDSCMRCPQIGTACLVLQDLCNCLKKLLSALGTWIDQLSHIKACWAKCKINEMFSFAATSTVLVATCGADAEILEFQRFLEWWHKLSSTFSFVTENLGNTKTFGDIQHLPCCQICTADGNSRMQDEQRFLDKHSFPTCSAQSAPCAVKSFVFVFLSLLCLMRSQISLQTTKRRGVLEAAARTNSTLPHTLATFLTTSSLSFSLQSVLTFGFHPSAIDTDEPFRLCKAICLTETTQTKSLGHKTRDSTSKMAMPLLFRFVAFAMPLWWLNLPS